MVPLVCGCVGSWGCGVWTYGTSRCGFSGCGVWGCDVWGCAVWGCAPPPPASVQPPTPLKPPPPRKCLAPGASNGEVVVRYALFFTFDFCVAFVDFSRLILTRASINK